MVADCPKLLRSRRAAAGDAPVLGLDCCAGVAREAAAGAQRERDADRVAAIGCGM